MSKLPCEKEDRKRVEKKEEANANNEKYFVRSQSRIRIKLQAIYDEETKLNCKVEEEVLRNRMLIKALNGKDVPLVEEEKSAVSGSGDGFHLMSNLNDGNSISDVPDSSVQSIHHMVHIGIDQHHLNPSLDSMINFPIEDTAGDGVVLIADAYVS